MAKLKAHVESEFVALRSGNSVSVRVKSVGDWWEADPQSKLFRLAERALYKEWQVWPLYVREGGTMVRARLQAPQAPESENNMLDSLAECQPKHGCKSLDNTHTPVTLVPSVG